MTSHGTGLSDNQRTAIGLVFTILLALNGSLAGLAAANQIVVPPLVYFLFGIAAVIVYAAKDQLGIRDATVARVAKEEVSTYPTFRTANPTG